MTIMPPSYQMHLQSQLTRAEYLLLSLLVNLLQSIKLVLLETLATALPFPITFDSRRKKIQRFLSRPQLTIEKIWFPILQAWLKADERPSTSSPSRHRSHQLGMYKFVDD